MVRSTPVNILLSNTAFRPLLAVLELFRTCVLIDLAFVFFGFYVLLTDIYIQVARVPRLTHTMLGLLVDACDVRWLVDEWLVSLNIWRVRQRWIPINM